MKINDPYNINYNFQAFETIVVNMRDSSRSPIKVQSPSQYVMVQNFNTSSILCLPSVSQNVIIKKKEWRRKCEGILQVMHNADNCQQYVCSQLDKDCIIEVTMELQYPNGTKETRINKYGPIILSPYFSYLLEGLTNESQEFEAQIISPNKTYSCVVVVSSHQLLLKNKTMEPNTHFVISIYDIVSMFIKNQNENILVFPYIHMRIICLKLFNDIISRTTYPENNDPLQVKIIDHVTTNNNNSKINMKFRRFLLKINHIKHIKAKTNNHSKGKTYKMPEFLDQDKKITNDTNHPLQHASNSLPPEKPQNINNITIPIRKILTEANEPQLISLPELNSINKKTANERPESIHENPQKQQKQQRQQKQQKQQTVGYFDDFDKVLNTGEQQNKQLIDLNDSFQMMEQKTESQEEKKKKQQVNENKKRREKIKKLKQKLQQVLNEREQLLQTNAKLKQQIQIMSRNSNQNNMYNNQSINQAKYQVQCLRREYQKLMDEKGKNYKKNPKFISENTIII